MRHTHTYRSISIYRLPPSPPAPLNITRSPDHHRLFLWKSLSPFFFFFIKQTIYYLMNFFFTYFTPSVSYNNFSIWCRGNFFVKYFFGFYLSDSHCSPVPPNVWIFYIKILFFSFFLLLLFSAFISSLTDDKKIEKNKTKQKNNFTGNRTALQS